MSDPRGRNLTNNRGRRHQAAANRQFTSLKENPTAHGWQPEAVHPKFGETVYSQGECKLMRLPTDWTVCQAPDGWDLEQLPAGRTEIRITDLWVSQNRHGMQSVSNDPLKVITERVLADERRPEIVLTTA